MSKCHTMRFMHLEVRPAGCFSWLGTLCIRRSKEVLSVSYSTTCIFFGQSWGWEYSGVQRCAWKRERGRRKLHGPFWETAENRRQRALCKKEIEHLLIVKWHSQHIKYSHFGLVIWWSQESVNDFLESRNHLTVLRWQAETQTRLFTSSVVAPVTIQESGHFYPQYITVAKWQIKPIKVCKRKVSVDFF